MTPRQQALLAFMKSYEAAHGYPPTFEEMAQGLSITGKSAISGLLKRLIDQGMVAHHEKFRARAYSAAERCAVCGKALGSLPEPL